MLREKKKKNLGKMKREIDMHPTSQDGCLGGKYGERKNRSGIL